MVEYYSGELSEKEHRVLLNEIYNDTGNVERTRYYVCPKEHLALIVKHKRHTPQMIMCPNCETLYHKQSEMVSYSKFHIKTQ